MISDREKQALECLELAAQADDPVVQKSLLDAAESLRFQNSATLAGLPGESGSAGRLEAD